MILVFSIFNLLGDTFFFVYIPTLLLIIIYDHYKISSKSADLAYKLSRSRYADGRFVEMVI